MLFIAMSAATASGAAAQTKSLKLYYLHTGEKAEIVFKRNGRFDAAGLKKINWFLRDWRRNEPTKMDPNLLDLVWEVYRKSGSNGYINVISGYRAPASNELLRSRGRGVAKNSQHTLGKAMDFFIPGVKLAKLRAIGLQMEVGGVGYYPTSGSPFVHLDTGNVRHWPRMSRSELMAVFPDGKTMHVPSDGKPLARYEQAVADYKRRSSKGKLVPETKGGNDLNFFQRLARATKDDEDDDADSGSAPAPRAVATTKTEPPKPEVTPAPAPAPAPQPEEPQFASLPARIPVPTLAPRQQSITSGAAVEIVTASADPVEAQEQQPEPVEPAPDEQSAGAETVLASLNLPVPSQRPNLEPANDQADNPLTENPQTAAQEETTQLALLPPNEAPQTARPQVAPLSPDEIEELRRLVRPQINDGNVASGEPVMTASVPVPTRPEPAEKIEVASLPIEPGTASTGALALPERNPVVIEQEQAAARKAAEDEARRQAELARLEQERLAQEEAQRLARLDEERKAAEEAVRLARIEEERKAAEQAAELARLEEAKAREREAMLASLPIPVRAPRSEQSPELPTASQQPVQTAALGKPATPAEPSLATRPVSLDRLSAPRENTSTIGKWALAANTTIERLADVQPPAYGRNIIRQVSGPVVVQNFALQPFGPGQNAFNGKAVKALKFAQMMN